MQPGVMAGGALIPLLGEITPEFKYSIAKSFIYTLHMLVEFHLPTSLFSFLHNYSFSFIYLQNIIPTDYIPTDFNLDKEKFYTRLKKNKKSHS